MKMEISWQENFIFKAKCGEHEVLTDQHQPEGGTDKALTPAELFVASLGTCLGVYIVRFCQHHNLPTFGLKIFLDWTVAKDPWRIGAIKADIHYPHKLSENERQGLMRFAKACFVHETIRQQPEIIIEMREK